MVEFAKDWSCVIPAVVSCVTLKILVSLSLRGSFEASLIISFISFASITQLRARIQAKDKRPFYRNDELPPPPPRLYGLLECCLYLAFS